jgi:hypothetical protein
LLLQFLPGFSIDWSVTVRTNQKCPGSPLGKRLVAADSAQEKDTCKKNNQKPSISSAFVTPRIVRFHNDDKPDQTRVKGVTISAFFLLNNVTTKKPLCQSDTLVHKNSSLPRKLEKVSAPSL